MAVELGSEHKTEARPAKGSHIRVGAFSRRGDYWTIGLGTSRFPIKDIKGLGYIQRLLQHPGKEFHALDLLNSADPGTIKADTVVGPEEALPVGITIRRGLIGDAGEMLDAQAKREYHRHLQELYELLQDQRERGNQERADQIESEIDFLKREIERAVGIGGRDRRTGSNAERARINVTRAIKTALEKISESDRTLGDWLDSRISTGVFCRYAEDSSESIVWQFSPDERGNALAPARPDPAYTHLAAPNLLLSLEDRTTFVGRDPEWDTLRRVSEEARTGLGRVVMIAGAPGVGKTRIAAEFGREAMLEGTMVLAGACYDRDDAVPFIPFVEMLEGALAQASNPQAFRDALANEASEIARFMPQLRRIFPDIGAPIELPPEQTRRVLLGAIMQVLARAAAARPILLLIDDLHWADEATLSLLNHLAHSIGRLPLMIIATYRDNELDLRSALATMLDEFTRLRVLSRIDLDGLSLNSVSEMIHALSGRKPPQSLTNLIFSGTEGNPFFIEELFRHMMERGILLDSSGEFRDDLAIDEIDVPQSLRLVIGRRLERLSEPTQRVLSTAALIGTSFTFHLLEAATGIGADQLLDQVEEAERSGLISGTIQQSESCFHFWHEMVRQAVISKLSAPRRQRLHLSIANAIERVYSDSLEDRANDLVHHLWHAGDIADPDRKLGHMVIAANRALQQSAYETVLLHTHKALQLRSRLSDTPQRERYELSLRISRGLALFATQGWSAAEAGDLYARARELAMRLHEDVLQCSALFGLFSFRLVRGQHPLARVFAEDLLELARLMNDDGMLVEAYWTVAANQIFVGEFSAALDTLGKAIAHYDGSRHRGLALLTAQDPLMSALVFQALVLWLLGYPDQAEASAQKALRLARDLQYPFTLAWCFVELSIYYSIRRDFDRALDLIEEGLSVCRENGYSLLEESLFALRMIGLTAQRKTQELGMASGRQRKFSEIDYELRQTWVRSALAEVLSKSGKRRVAQSLLTQANAIMERNEERFVDAELFRIRGELLLDEAAAESTSTDQLQEAEQSFVKAIETAHNRRARMFELRAAISLARLMQRTGRASAAATLLKETCAGFNEGFGTWEFRAAQSLLRDLGNDSSFG